HSALRNCTSRTADTLFPLCGNPLFFCGQPGGGSSSSNDLTLTSVRLEEGKMITSAFRHLSQIGTALLTVSVAVLLTVSVAVPTPEANAQSFPSIPIRFVVPTNASTPPDIISRVIAGELSDREGWRI